MTDVEREIRTLAKVKGLEPTQINLWKVAFEHYSERYTRFQNRIYKSEEEIRSVKNEIYQVVGFFSAFQGLLITAAAQSVLLRCNNVRFILALSAFATAVAVFGIWQKITAMAGLRFANNRNKHYMKEIRLWLFHLQDHGMDFHFDNLSHLSMPFSNSRMWWKEILVGYGTLLVVSVIAFGGLCMVAMRQIVCNPGHSLPSN
ncbi:hypothetical protein CY35_13G108100 [Sphagnum magellanicum]|nr:hypothetical protein CY35_13G108100 [Sphagnum magellanicum]KAH9544240.1 hypothetical protein CY35_13G108100 [Sphagnum magellanicum]